MDERDGVRNATLLNRELTALLIDVGQQMGWSVRTEYGVPGGRLDVVWLWEPASPLPGLHDPVPVVGFEIESSWRTRKHVKGDLLNIQDAGVALGVIVLAGADARDDSLRRFATALVDRPGAQVLVWTEADVRALAAGEPAHDSLTTAWSAAQDTHPMTGSGSTDTQLMIGELVNHTGKYRPLWEWLRMHERQEVRVTFDQIEQLLGLPLPDSCRHYAAHWHSYQGSAVARAIIDAGWHAARVEFANGAVTMAPGVPPRRSRARQKVQHTNPLAKSSKCRCLNSRWAAPVQFLT